jgi:hypothetical protein
METVETGFNNVTDMDLLEPLKLFASSVDLLSKLLYQHLKFWKVNFCRFNF